MQGKPAVLIDLSGTLHVEDSPTPRAVEALQKLRDNAFQFRFVSNTTKDSSHALLSRLNRLDFYVDPSEVFTSLSATKDVLRTIPDCRPLLFLEEGAKEDFTEWNGKQGKPNCVVVGLSPTLFNYDRLTEAMHVLLDGGRLIAMHKGRYFKRSDGLALGPGPFVALLEYATSCTASIVGKPSPEFFQLALQSLGGTVGHAIMIGDDVRDDVDGALAAGLDGYLVRTGKYRQGDEDCIAERGGVTGCFDCFADVVDHLVEKYR